MRLLSLLIKSNIWSIIYILFYKIIDFVTQYDIIIINNIIYDGNLWW